MNSLTLIVCVSKESTGVS